jgi:hypothetical protein
MAFMTNFVVVNAILNAMFWHCVTLRLSFQNNSFATTLHYPMEIQGIKKNMSHQKFMEIL